LAVNLAVMKNNVIPGQMKIGVSIAELQHQMEVVPISFFQALVILR
jgi:hypothetical protein